jgi:hypothetical protein
MSRQKWTSDKQEAWLKKAFEKFELATLNDTRKQFYKKNYSSWLEKFPNPEPTHEQIIAAGSCEKAIKIIYDDKEHVSTSIDTNVM